MHEVEDLIDIPTYYQRFCDKDVDLNVTRNIPCKFHGEVHGKSFTFSPEKGVFRCWGQCKCGGGVIQLHRLNYHLRDDEEARKSLENILGIVRTTDKQLIVPKVVEADEVKAELNALIAKCVRRAKTVEQWLELDYVMSQYPVEKEKLELFLDNL